MDWQSRIGSTPPYQIIESQGFAEQFAELVESPQLRDELQRVFYLDLPVDPEKFEVLYGNVRVAMVSCIPPLTLFFSVKDRVITLLEIHPLLGHEKRTVD